MSTWSERRATMLLGVDRSSVRYQKKRKTDDAERRFLNELAVERRRFGYRRLREMVLTRILSGPHSTASARDSERIPAFAAPA